MKEIYYCLADDGKRFDDRWDCIDYERQKALETHKDEFVFLDYRKEPMPIKNAIAEEIVYIIVKSDSCAEAISNWFEHKNCLDPFGGVYCECVGTWAYGEILDRDDEWFKIEFEIEKLQTLIDEINK